MTICRFSLIFKLPLSFSFSTPANVPFLTELAFCTKVAPESSTTKKVQITINAKSEAEIPFLIELEFCSKVVSTGVIPKSSRLIQKSDSDIFPPFLTELQFCSKVDSTQDQRPPTVAKKFKSAHRSHKASLRSR